jgi:hypothetical protein
MDEKEEYARIASPEFREKLLNFVLGYMAQKEAMEKAEEDSEELLGSIMYFSEVSDDLLKFKEEALGQENAGIPDMNTYFVDGAYNGHVYRMYAAAVKDGFLPVGNPVNMYEMYYIGKLLQGMQ